MQLTLKETRADTEFGIIVVEMAINVLWGELAKERGTPELVTHAQRLVLKSPRYFECARTHILEMLSCDGKKVEDTAKTLGKVLDVALGLTGLVGKVKKALSE